MEKGTTFREGVDADEQRNVEVFRVPAHNDVEGADFYHDFKMVSGRTIIAFDHFTFNPIQTALF